MMEVKVWVEGIPRVVCGVSDNTTCQDIVLALAHATGKTGRFTLVEKWRDNERLLAPVDCPLKVLHKWGEYSSDVQFILKHSDKDRKKQSSGRRKKDKPADTADGKPSSTAIKKAFTFSGVHARSTGGLQNGHSLVNHSHQNSLPNGYLDNSDCGSDVASQQHGQSLQDNAVTAFQPNQTLNLLHLDSPSQSKASQDSSVSHNAVNQNKGLAKEKISNSKDGVVPDFKSKENGSCQTVITSPGERTVDGSGPDDTVRQEMVQLVSLQKNRIKDQEGRLRELEAELNYWEKCEGENNRQAQDVEKQIKSLEKSEMEVNDQLQELELVSWADKVDMAKSTKTALQRDLAGLKQQLQKVESELKGKQTRIKEMTQNIAVELESIKKKQGEMKENVEKDIEVIKQELYDKCTKEKETQATISKIEDELKENQVTVTEKKLQIADIEKEIKEVNLENFTHAPNLLNTEGCGDIPFNKQRPGSARRLPGSPQKLGDAVPTAKNPQGLWV